MAREAKREYRYHEDGAIALYRRPNSAMWYARCKLDDGAEDRATYTKPTLKPA